MSIWKSVAKDKEVNGTLKNDMLDWALHIGVALLIALFIIKFIGQLTFVQGPSMQPTLQNGDWIVMEKLVQRFGELKRGDIVILEAAEILERSGENRDRSPLIKRIIGVGGDTISVVDGSVFVNGEKISEDYIGGALTNSEGLKYVDNIKVPEGSIYVMGDNRNNSLDSRVLGFFSLKDVKGRAYFRILPLKTIGLMTK